MRIHSQALEQRRLPNTTHTSMPRLLLYRAMLYDRTRVEFSVPWRLSVPAPASVKVLGWSRQTLE